MPRNQILANYFYVFYISKIIRYWPANLLSHLSFQYLKRRESPYLFNCKTAIFNSNISLFSSEQDGKKEIDLWNWFDGFISWNTHISIMFTINMSVFPSIWPISNKLFSVWKRFQQDEVYWTDQIIGVPKTCIYINKDLRRYKKWWNLFSLLLVLNRWIAYNKGY